MFKKLGVLSLMVVASLILNGEETVKYEGKLEETVVTATGFEDTQNSQIKNITVIPKEDIKNKGYNSVEEILRNAPGVNFTYNQFGFVADIRGQGSEEALKRVKVLVDGVQMSILDVSHGFTPVNTIPVENIEKIEIINGGGSVLYGGGTSGGVINIITKKTQEKDVTGKFYYQNSSFETNKFGLSTGIKMGEKVLLNLGYENINGKGYRKLEEKSSDGLNAGLTFNLTEKQKLTLGASKFIQDYVDTGAISKSQLENNRKDIGDTKTVGNIEKDEYTLNYLLNVGENLKFDLKGYYQKTDRKYIQNSESSMTFGRIRVPYTQSTDGLFKDEKKGINLKGNYKYNRGELILGYDYMENSAVRNASGIVAYTIPAGMMGPGSPARPMRHITNTKINLEKTTNSVFLLNKLELTNKFEGILGYRYENAKYDINRTNSTSTLNAEKTENNNAYEVGLNYKYSNTGNVYVKYERGFRSPSPTEMTDAINSVYTTNNVKPETFNTYEIGVKDYIGNSYVSATAFLTDTKNEIYTNMIVHGRTWKTENIQETSRKGVELFAEQYLGKFRINESLSYVDAKVSKGDDKGNRIPYVPKVKATLGAVYDILPELSLKADINYFSSARDTGNYKIKSYSTADLGLNYRHESGFSLQTGVKNLFGRKYNLYESTINDAYIPAPERTYYIGVSYDF